MGHCRARRAGSAPALARARCSRSSALAAQSGTLAAQSGATAQICAVAHLTIVTFKCYNASPAHAYCSAPSVRRARRPLPTAHPGPAQNAFPSRIPTPHVKYFSLTATTSSTLHSKITCLSSSIAGPQHWLYVPLCPWLLVLKQTLKTFFSLITFFVNPLLPSPPVVVTVQAVREQQPLLLLCWLRFMWLLCPAPVPTDAHNLLHYPHTSLSQPLADATCSPPQAVCRAPRNEHAMQPIQALMRKKSSRSPNTAN